MAVVRVDSTQLNSTQRGGAGRLAACDGVGSGCAQLGLRVSVEPVPGRVLQRVWESQGYAARVYWYLAGYYDGASICTVELGRGGRAS